MEGFIGSGIWVPLMATGLAPTMKRSSSIRPMRGGITLSDEMEDMPGRNKSHIAEPTTGVLKPDDDDKWLKPLYLGLTDVPNVYSASSASGSDTMSIFLRFEGAPQKRGTPSP